MLRFTLLAAVFGLAAAALADDTAAARPGPWNFRPGQAYEYTCHTDFAYSNGSYTRTYKNPCGSGNLTETIEKSTKQSETIDLRATVKAVGDDGAARLTFEVLRAQVDATDGDSGVTVAWDSRTQKLPPEGYLRWASLVGHKFDAIIGADGAVRELKDPDWPTDAIKSLNMPKAEIKASKDHHDPAAKKTWLELIFSTAPQQKAWVNEFHFPIPEKMDFAPDGRERLDSETCPRVKFDTQEHPANPADAMPKERHKRGESWWSGRYVATWKAECRGVDEAKLYKPGLMGTIAWTVQLKNVGVVELPKPVSEEKTK